ncbi:MAG TPA: OmpH family outer membrane protein [Thioalkalivibrio sp.]|nr:OmpH family outer membrane protein [Thioalkalivibrio sp.]
MISRKMTWKPSSLRWERHSRPERGEVLKRFITAIVVSTAIFLAGIQTTLAADLMIGVVNVPKLLEQSPQKAAADKALEDRFGSRANDLRAEGEVLKKLEERYETDGPTMSAAQKAELERELRERGRELKRAQDNFRDDLNFARNEEYGKVQRDVLQAIVKVSEDGKYDLVLTENVVYASQRVDITDKVLQQLRSMPSQGR